MAVSNLEGEQEKGFVGYAPEGNPTYSKGGDRSAGVRTDPSTIYTPPVCICAGSYCSCVQFASSLLSATAARFHPFHKTLFLTLHFITAISTVFLLYHLSITVRSPVLLYQGSRVRETTKQAPKYTCRQQQQ